jgi:N-acetylmuramoyl-L-alanine amidase
MLFVKDIENFLLKHPTKTYSFRDTNTINKIIVHQTDAPDNDAFTPYEIAQYHVNDNDWAGIGYHYVIVDSGQIYLTQKANKISYHASGSNTNSIGVAITGDHRLNNPSIENEDLISKKEYKSLIYLLAKLKEKYNIPYENIIGHNETTTLKSCPNLNMDVVRKDVKKKILVWNIIRVSGVLLGITFVIYGTRKYLN